MRLLAILNKLNRAGVKALKDSRGLVVDECHVALLRQRHLTFDRLVEVKISGSTLQKIHLGWDEGLGDSLGDVPAQVAEEFFRQLAKDFGDRIPRAEVSVLKAGSAVLNTRGVRTFEFRLTAAGGRFFYLVEVPSRAEVEMARGSEYLPSLEAVYLPGDWRNLDEIDDAAQVKDVFAFLAKVEGDVYLEVPAGDGTATVNSGLIMETVQRDDRLVLKLCTDLTDSGAGVPEAGDLVRATVGLGDRSLEFEMRYVGVDGHRLDDGAVLPCALFALPGRIAVGQRRRSFRVGVPGPLHVELECALGLGESSPWSDNEGISKAVRGRLVDLSFSGARIIAGHEELISCFQPGSRVVCRIHFQDQGRTVSLLGVVRRAAAGLMDGNKWGDDLGIEFLMSPGMDRSSLDFIRQYVLEIQRANLAQRIRLAGV